MEKVGEQQTPSRPTHSCFILRQFPLVQDFGEIENPDKRCPDNNPSFLKDGKSPIIKLSNHNLSSSLSLSLGNVFSCFFFFLPLFGEEEDRRSLSKMIKIITVCLFPMPLAPTPTFGGFQWVGSPCAHWTWAPTFQWKRNLWAHSHWAVPGLPCRVCILKCKLSGNVLIQWFLEQHNSPQFW